MSRVLYRGILQSIPLLCVALLAANPPVPEWRVLNQQARQAAKASDYAKLRATLLQLMPLMPGNPRVTYNLAASNAKLGNPAAALAGLVDLAGMGLIYDIAADDDFASLRGTSEYAATLARMKTSALPVSGGKAAFALAEPDLIPEDIAYDVKTRRFFISGSRQGKIVTADGKEFAKADLPVLALAVDSERRILWASMGWLPWCEHCRDSDKDHTALLAFDLDSGKLRQRIESPQPGLLGDMTIGHNGDVFVSEGVHGAVLHLAPGASTLRRLDKEGEFPSPQTPALSADEDTLYVPDYLRGIAAINLRTQAVRWMQPAADIATNGIDGLYFHKGSFIAVQNGTLPERIVQFSGDLQRQKVLEANTPGLGDPTHGTFAGDDFYFLANTGGNIFDEAGKKKPGATAVQSTVRKVKIEGL